MRHSRTHRFVAVALLECPQIELVSLLGGCGIVISVLPDDLGERVR